MILIPILNLHHVAYAMLPFEFFSDNFEANLKSYIMRCEIGAGIAALFTFPEVLAGRRFIFFVDNSNALSALLNGYSRKYDCAYMVNLFHIGIAALECDPYGEWCPSHANPADVGTRPERLQEIPHYLRPHLRWRPLVLPSQGYHAKSLEHWARYLRDWRLWKTPAPTVLWPSIHPP